MATTSLWPIHNTGSRGVKSVVKQLVDYASNEEKTAQKKSNGVQSAGTMQSVMGYVSKEEKVNRDHQENRMDFLSAPGSFDAEDDDEACRMIMGHLAGGNDGRRYVTGINCFPQPARTIRIIIRKQV